MTVAELIEELQMYPRDASVVLTTGPFEWYDVRMVSFDAADSDVEIHGEDR